MSLPLTTTTVLVEDRTDDGAYDATPAYSTRGTFPAHVSAPSGSEQVGGPGLERIDAALLIDTEAGAQRGDRVTDQTTSAVYRVAWVAERSGLGLAHLRCGLVDADGGTPA